MMLMQQSVNSDWQFNTQSRVLQAEWFILDINEKATLNISMPFTPSHFSCGGSGARSLRFYATTQLVVRHTGML